MAFREPSQRSHSASNQPFRFVGAHWAFAICVALYLYVFPYQARINNPNENVRFYMTMAIVDEGTYAIDTPRARYGWVNDAAIVDGHYYSVKAPGTSLLGVPGYAIYRAAISSIGRPFDRTEALWACRFSASILPTLVWLFFFQRFLDRFTRHAVLRDAVFLSVALGSLLYGYALLFVSHTLSAVVAFSVIMLLERERDEVSQARALFAGFCAAAVTWLEYPGLVASVPLAIYAAVRVGQRRLVALSLGALPAVLSMMHFQWRAFGSPFTPGHRYLETKALKEAMHQGFFGAVGFDPEAMFALLFDPAYGLFPLTPILALFPLGLVVGLLKPRLRGAVLTSLFVSVLTWAAICTMNNWRGGWTIGPRYLAVAVPFLAWLTLLGLDTLAQRARPVTVGFSIGATAVAFLLSGALCAYYPHLPEVITRPVREVLEPLVRYDFAPMNAGNLFGLFGTASMLPWAAVMLLALIGLSFSGMRRSNLLAKFAVVVSIVVSAYSVARVPLAKPTETNQRRRALALITSHWEPSGHDALAVLLREPPQGRDAAWEQRVMRVYRALGRDQEAHALEQNARSHRRRR